MGHNSAARVERPTSGERAKHRLLQWLELRKSLKAAGLIVQKNLVLEAQRGL